VAEKWRRSIVITSLTSSQSTNAKNVKILRRLCNEKSVCGVDSGGSEKMKITIDIPVYPEESPVKLAVLAMEALELVKFGKKERIINFVSLDARTVDNK